MAENYVNQMRDYQDDLDRYHAARGDLNQRYERMRAQMQALTQGEELQDYATRWQQVLNTWNAWENARRNHQQAESHFLRIRDMAKTAPAPHFPDTMTYSEEETARLLSDYSTQQRQLQLQMGQCQGAMAALGDEQVLQNRISALRQRLSRLEETYDALTYALETLEGAAAELQRRFAPRIAARAQELFGKLTDGRYDRLSLTQELTVNAGAEGENTLRAAQWRSEGTVDQLYLALRLAVAGELTPNVPLVLDDVLVRFDDHRMKKAMELLNACAKTRQVILFSCQGREAAVQGDF